MNFSNIDVYDLKSKFNRVKAAVLNLTELEQKVKEATNNDAWGASSTLMMELSRATHDYQGFNEVMPALYKRFVETGKSWRNVYKALTLLEYLVKNGSERVVDYARAHTYDLKALSNFHHIDEKGKDQGVNIRHRAKLILDLLASDDLIRDERNKAKANRDKYSGTGSDTSGGFGGGYSGGFGGSGSRYGGYGPNSISSGSSSAYPGNSNRRYSDAEPASAGGGTGTGGGYTSSSNLYGNDGSANANHDNDEFGDFQSGKYTTNPQPVPQSTAKVVDLLSFGSSPERKSPNSDEWGAFTPAPVNNSSTLNDDFANFQSAPIASVNSASFTTNPSSASNANSFANYGNFASTPAQNQFQNAFAAPPAQNNTFGNFTQFPNPSISAPKSNVQPASAMPDLMGGSPPLGASSAPVIAPTSSLLGQSSSGVSSSTPVTATTSSTTSNFADFSKPDSAKPKNELWNSNLVNLDGLGKFANQNQQSGPSMNSMNQGNAASTPTRQVSQPNFTSFTSAIPQQTPVNRPMDTPAMNTMGMPMQMQMPMQPMMGMSATSNTAGFANFASCGNANTMSNMNIGTNNAQPANNAPKNNNDLLF